MDYTEIVALAKAYSDRETDADITANVDNFIKIVEAKLNRLLKIDDMAVRAQADTVDDQAYFALPSDFNGLRDVELQSGGKSYTCEYVSPIHANALSTYTSLDGYYYTIIAGQLHILPVQDAGSTVEIVYYPRLDPLDSTDTTNWISDTYPDLYVYGIMVEISAFVKNATAVTLWEERFNKAVQDLTHRSSGNQWSGTPLRIRTD